VFVKEQLEWMVKQGIISAVTMPMEWVHPLVVVPKPGGKWRLCVDLTKLNFFVKRPVHPLTTPKEAVDRVPEGSVFFATLDAKHGYWQIPLEEASQELTTFITPFGCFKFLRNPMGLASAQDEYCRRTDLAIAGLEKVSKVVDDMLVYSKTAEDHVQDVVELLERCRLNKITLNPDKFAFGRTEVKFVGYIVNSDGVCSDPAKVKAIAEFPAPTNITELRGFMGLVNQLGSFSARIAETAGPLRDLLKKKNAYVWSPAHEEAFAAVKKALVSTPILAHFDPRRETQIRVDCSRLKGIGFALYQLHGEQWKLVVCGSRFLSDTETRYAMIELEMLGVAWAITKCRIYLLGMEDFEVVTDHKPLIPILNSYSLDQIENQRLQRLRNKITL